MLEKQVFNLSKVKGTPSPRGRARVGADKITLSEVEGMSPLQGRGLGRGGDLNSSEQSISPSLEFVSSHSFANKFFSLPRRDSRIAFTLAELLITLGVIGVVAAITLPTVINIINDHNFKVAYKKAYRDINEAYRMMKATDDEFEEIVCDSANTSVCEDRTYDRNFELLAKQFKATKTCFMSNGSKKYSCLKCRDKTTHECLGIDASAFIDNSGRVWAMYFYKYSILYVDTNGDKGPNLTGKDRWGFLLPDPRNNRTNKNFIEPYYTTDLKTKSNRCTSGDCNYKSWLE